MLPVVDVWTTLTESQFNSAGGSASDYCGVTSYQYKDQVSGNCPQRNIYRTFKVTDQVGNSTTCTQTILITDDEAPQITTPASNGNAQCNGNSPDQHPDYLAWLDNYGGAEATDNCELTWSYNSSLGWQGDDCEWAITVDFTATDDCGNSVTSTASFTIVDTQPPLIGTQAAGQTVECDGAGNTAAFDTWLNSHAGATASDVCGSPITWSYVQGTWSDECGNSKRITVTFYATDDCGNKSLGTAAVFYIQDKTPPSITSPAKNKTVECDGLGNTVEYAAWLDAHADATASDVCGGPITWSYVQGTWSDECGNSKRITVTFYATDDCGNKSVGTAAVFYIQDKTPPSITNPAQNQTVECDGAGNTVAYNSWLNSHASATAADVCGGPITWSYVEGTWSDECGNSKRITVTFYATDDCGNKSLGTAAVFYIQDKTPPSITTPAQNKTVECDGFGNTAEYAAWLDAHANATASDVCGGPITWSYVEGTWSDECGNSKRITVTFYATDDCGNKSVGTAAVFYIQDKTPPSITSPAKNKTVECDGLGNTAEYAAWLDAHADATASDVCGGPITWSYVQGTWSDECGNSKRITVTFYATDDCGNKSVGTAAVFYIQDKTPPSITSPAQNKTVECDGFGNTAEYAAWLDAHANATASDVCGGPITWSYVEGTWSDECGNSTRILVTFYATDDCGNKSLGTAATFRIQDTQAPIIGTPAQNMTVECDGSGNTAAYALWLSSHAGATASDVCGGPITWSYVEGAWSDECGNSKRITVTFYATDDCGNKSLGTAATFRIQDTQAPIIGTQAQNLTVECDGSGNTAAYATWLSSHAGATASDVCGGPITWSYVQGTWSDECGNSTASPSPSMQPMTAGINLLAQLQHSEFRTHRHRLSAHRLKI